MINMKVTPEIVEEMKQYRDAGRTIKDCMAKFHLSESTVIRLTKKKTVKMGLPIPKVESEYFEHTQAF